MIPSSSASASVRQQFGAVDPDTIAAHPPAHLAALHGRQDAAARGQELHLLHDRPRPADRRDPLREPSSPSARIVLFHR